LFGGAGQDFGPAAEADDTDFDGGAHGCVLLTEYMKDG
jgi:hypothetical protein